MLFVVAWPVLAEDDEQALRRLRAQYHPREADLIGPHFTLVFAAPTEEEEVLRTLLRRIERRSFWFVLERIVRFDAPPPSRAAYLYAEPAAGAAELTALHETLNPSGGGELFQPHITLGLFERAAEAERIARIVERQHLPMHGRIGELALLCREGDRLKTLTTISLGS